MKETIKTIISIASNWRIVTLTIMWAITALLIMADCDDLGVFITIKALGFALGYISYRLSQRWDGQMPELSVFNDDE